MTAISSSSAVRPIVMTIGKTAPKMHSVRLFAVMLAGHITLKVFAGFVVAPGGMGG